MVTIDLLRHGAFRILACDSGACAGGAADGCSAVFDALCLLESCDF